MKMSLNTMLGHAKEKSSATWEALMGESDIPRYKWMLEFCA